MISTAPPPGGGGRGGAVPLVTFVSFLLARKCHMIA